ncbi:MAG: class I SAM-dependent methyltransferase [Gemmatimonadales bacterium]|nr:class I SAM-dependent methyltransferase [Gemmatimonadales bacterium]MDZ4389582.1 class I SAM-dependent methyltransferase [Gemmatimonadales bacterium]
MKNYDQSYFDHWYRNPRHRIGSRADLERSVALAVALAEGVLGREIESVLDVGAGEGRWQPVLQRLRPGSRYAGVEPSEWAVRRWGQRRNLRQGSLLDLAELGLEGPFDLVICADVLHYLPTAVLRRGLRALADQVGGVAFCPLFTVEDSIDGDREEFQRRRASTYRRCFAEAGLIAVGMHGWTTSTIAASLARLERQ